MKILFEAVNGKKGTKEFKTLSEVKSFVIKNKNVIKEAQIMEGPLGSGGWTPKKAWNQFKKGMDKKANYKKIDSVKDSFGKEVNDYIHNILHDITKKDNNFNAYGLGIDKHGYYIGGINLGSDYITRNMDDDGLNRLVNFKSDKYDRKVYMPKLTKYIEKHHSLPSEKQLRAYIENLIDSRYKQNYEKDRKRNPERHMSRTDVENF